MAMSAARASTSSCSQPYVTNPPAVTGGCRRLAPVSVATGRCLPSIERRAVQPELLDNLPTNDPRAVRARRDLQTINAVMGHPRIIVRSMKSLRAAPRRVIELGGGDGTLLLRI